MNSKGCHSMNEKPNLSHGYDYYLKRLHNLTVVMALSILKLKTLDN